MAPSGAPISARPGESFKHSNAKSWPCSHIRAPRTKVWGAFLVTLRSEDGSGTRQPRKRDRAAALVGKVRRIGRPALLENDEDRLNPCHALFMNSYDWSILVVDDQTDLADVLTEMLRMTLGSHTVVDKVYSGQNAIAAAKQRPYDVVITDLAMPRVDGFQVGAAIKGLSPALLLIAVSGNRNLVEVASSGQIFDHALAKPVDVEHIVDLCRPPAGPAQNTQVDVLLDDGASAMIQFRIGFEHRTISLESEHEARAWCDFLKCSYQELRRALATVGNNRASVELFLATKTG